MSDYIKPMILWITGSLIALFKYITFEDLVLCFQLIAFIITIAYTLWKWYKDKRRAKNHIPTEVKNNGQK
ncbi:hypothetical protein D9V86_12015 [Bacteroidetes/Chlorobi group bacterium ChocPot_Mid]|nr:MAG: hypothetical protein D9V86_12015 [Bacteroidetes/Chlorobi group bacterium ChocPot_Mid]